VERLRVQGMFQTFDDTAEPQLSRERVAGIRQKMQELGIDAYVVPRSDEFQGEYVAPSSERLRWLTGFSGSAGLCIVTRDQAVLFTDGRYTIQARQQVDPAIFSIVHSVEEPPHQWLAKNLAPGSVVGYDPWLTTAEAAERLRKACTECGAVLKAVEPNLVDSLWQDRPSAGAEPVSVHPAQFAGRVASEKIADIGAELEKAKADATVLTLPDSVAWLLNIRGRDVPHTPIVLAHAIVRQAGRAELFIEPSRLPEDVAAHLARVADVQRPAELKAALQRLGQEGLRVLVDPEWAADAIVSALQSGGAEIVKGKDPCLLPKARKNATEREGARSAQRRDGIAMARFLHWFDMEAPGGALDEIAAVTALERFRRDSGVLKDVSFDTIAGAGEHAAIPHYRVSTRSNLAIKPDQVFLIDSGAQYEDGTTDVTRTVIVGEPSAEMRDRFTRVLRGLIAISRLHFPKGTMGGHIDAFARSALWSAGLDYDHGTGHGVGSYLSVHEGPARLSKSDRMVLEPGMILSNEPGYYKEGAFGIRIENLIMVSEPMPIAGGERPMMGFETLTLVPIDLRLVEPALLDEGERDWLNAYHQRVHREISPFLNEAERHWLDNACRPVGNSE
jgi:Xaa-Pro aminopeptidase